MFFIKLIWMMISDFHRMDLNAQVRLNLILTILRKRMILNKTFKSSESKRNSSIKKKSKKSETRP